MSKAKVTRISMQELYESIGLEEEPKPVHRFDEADNRCFYCGKLERFSKPEEECPVLLEA